MNRPAIAALAAGAITTAAAAATLNQARWQIRQNRLLFEQMEQDHAALVKLYLETRDRFRVMTPKPDITPEELAEHGFDDE